MQRKTINSRGNSGKLVRLTDYAFKELHSCRDTLVEGIKANPERYPAYAGRYLTLSDVVILLLQGKGLVE